LFASAGGQDSGGGCDLTDKALRCDPAVKPAGRFGYEGVTALLNQAKDVPGPSETLWRRLGGRGGERGRASIRLAKGEGCGCRGAADNPDRLQGPIIRR